MTRRLLFFLFITGLIVSCHPGGAEYVDELDIVLTTYDKAFDFKTATTFALPAKIPVISGSVITGDLPEFLRQDKADVILNQIRTNMVSRGYTELSGQPQNADLIIMPATMSSTTIVYYCDYWGGYWGWWGGYPGYGGCYYPSGYSYTTGSVLITMQNGKTTPSTINLWSAGVNGLLEGSDASIAARVQKSLNQAFAQSPYISKN